MFPASIWDNGSDPAFPQFFPMGIGVLCGIRLDCLRPFLGMTNQPVDRRDHHQPTESILLHHERLLRSTALPAEFPLRPPSHGDWLPVCPDQSDLALFPGLQPLPAPRPATFRLRFFGGIGCFARSQNASATSSLAMAHPLKQLQVFHFSKDTLTSQHSEVCTINPVVLGALKQKRFCQHR